MANYSYYRFGQAYGDGAYSACAYSGGQCPGQGTATSDSSLVNSGVAVAGIVTLACLIVLIAVLVRIWRRPSSKAVLQEETVEDETGHNLPNDPS